MKYESFHLGADAGGTNTSIGVFGKNGKSLKLVSYSRFESSELKSMEDALNRFIKLGDNFKIGSACLGVAGPIYNDGKNADLRKLGWKINSDKISKLIGAKTILINDFEAAGYGINTLSKRDFSFIQKGNPAKNAPKIIIGAGTGLGKSLLTFNKEKNCYVPVGGEAGHMDFSAQNDEEFEMAYYFRKKNSYKNNVPYEEFLSGRGLSLIYSFYAHKYGKQKSKHHAEILKSKLSPEKISLYRNDDAICRKTFEKFSQFYARFAKCCALDSMAIGGVYIAGGIAPKNPDIFGKTFVNEFANSKRHHDILKKIPIYLVKNQGIGLKGAAFAAWKLTT